MKMCTSNLNELLWKWILSPLMIFCWNLISNTKIYWMITKCWKIIIWKSLLRLHLSKMIILVLLIKLILLIYNCHWKVAKKEKLSNLNAELNKLKNINGVLKKCASKFEVQYKEVSANLAKCVLEKDNLIEQMEVMEMHHVHVILMQ